MSEQNNVTVNTLEDAWKLSQEKGYEGSFEDFRALCEKLDKEADFEKMDLSAMESVAGGGFVSAMEAAGEWCKDHKDLLIATTGTLAAGVAGYLTYRYMSGGSGDTGRESIVSSDGFSGRTISVGSL